MNDIVLPDMNFDGLNEADIRAEVIDPVIRALGYRSGTQNNILRERQIELRYPHIFLGRKQPSKDPALRGRPDYVCEVRSYGRWVIEAKPPSVEIGIDDIEQTHSYAVHAEIQAPLYVLTNGRRFLVFESNRGPAAGPLIDFRYDDLQRQFHVIERVLRPEALQARYPLRAVDFGKPLAPGFGSSVKLVGGFTRYENVAGLVTGIPEGTPGTELSNLDRLIGLELPIVGDTCFRDATDGIVANVRVPQFHTLMKEFAQSLNIEVNRYTCRDHEVSMDPENPNIFETGFETIIPAGTETLDVTSWSKTITPVDVPIAFHAEAIGHFANQRFQGLYAGRIISQFSGGGISIGVWVFFRGVYEIEIISE